MSSSTGTVSALEVRGLGQSYRGLKVLNDINVDVKRGECVATIGPNGAGKTTLFNCITAVSPPKTGSIRLLGQEATGMRPAQLVRLGLARTFQHLALFNTMTVLENVLMGRQRFMDGGAISTTLRPMRSRRQEAEQTECAAELVKRFGLESVMHQEVKTLPHGTGKLVELARAVAMEPDVLLLDEPAAGLNTEESAQFTEHLRAIRAENPDLAILLIEHDMPLVLEISDRVMVLNFGHEVLTGTPSEVVQDPRVIDAYLGRQRS